MPATVPFHRVSNSIKGYQDFKNLMCAQNGPSKIVTQVMDKGWIIKSGQCLALKVTLSFLFFVPAP